MKYSLFHIILSAFMALLLLFGTSSKEFIHEFAAHQDTTSCQHAHDHGPVWDPPHHHCDFLSFVLSVFAPPILPDWSLPHVLWGLPYQEAGESALKGSDRGSNPVRGPPGLNLPYA